MEQGPRIQRQQKTIAAMINLYCRKHHNPIKGDICDDCTELLHYAIKRLDLCSFQEMKPTCGNCTRHCYKPSMQKKTKEVMRFSGPRMVLYHPVLALFHLLDGYRKNQV